MLGDEAIILNTRTGRYFGLNPVGARVWQLLQERNLTVGEILESLLAEYEVEPYRCRQDLFDLLEQLQSQGLVQITSAS